MKEKNILWFKEVSMKNVPQVGGKNASLGEMYVALTKRGVRIPNGFAVTAQAYQSFLRANKLDKKIAEILKGLNVKKLSDLEKRGAAVRKAMMSASIPEEMKEEIGEAYRTLSAEYGKGGTDVAVRSSATAEDLPGASFAGQQETYLNVVGEKELLESVKKCFASLFTNRAISYREDKGFDHLSTYLSVGVQKMVRSDKASSGVAFTLDPDTGFRGVVVINGSWGLGELVVQGEVIPDEFHIAKEPFKKGHPAIILKELGSKEKTLIYGSKERTRLISTKTSNRNKFVLSDKEVLELADWCLKIEEHYKKPMDIEWAKDGTQDKLYIVQARPETVQASKDVETLEDYEMKKTGKLVTKGAAIGSKIAEGPAKVIKSAKNIKQFKKGEVLVTRMTDPDWEPIMKIASAIVTDEGGRTSHAAIVSRELGIPCVVGTENATRIIKNGAKLTVDCSSGTEGFVWEGKTEWEKKTYELKEFVKPKTKIMVNIGSPDEAYEASFLPAQGVGLAREEFIIASRIKVHPMALLHPEKTDALVKAKIKKVISGYKSGKVFYVNRLAEGIAQIGTAFYPNEVIVRFSDFKTNEYAQLLGGKYFEPKEENPMIGWRGASRYYDPRFKEAFGLECNALKKVRDEFGLTNVTPMIPFCRTPEEGKKVIETMAEFGLKQGENGLKVYMMAEIPSNVILAEEFLKIFDGFSIGSNDLTQLTVGIDRDNTELGKIADERNEAVKISVGKVIEAAKTNGKYVGICGQAPSDYEDFAAFLVGKGIESISLNPDSVVKTSVAILKKEKQLRK
ncbi:MAG: phosphoenolpyruvate synthase [Patescibacteria group bacterium]|nr:phosphoenolpyruvate synthase [Patescibacteria group bacterium]